MKYEHESTTSPSRLREGDSAERLATLAHLQSVGYTRGQALAEMDGRRNVANAYFAVTGLVNALSWAGHVANDGGADHEAVKLLRELVGVATAMLAAGFDAESHDLYRRVLVRRSVLTGHVDGELRDAAEGDWLEDTIDEIRHVQGVLHCVTLDELQP